jgi:hypothetical protein
MYLHKVYIRYKEDLPEDRNAFAALEGFRQLGIETAPFYGFGDINTLNDLGPEVGITGFVGDTLNALTKLGIPHPSPMDYPEEIQECLGRRVWKTTMGEVRGTTQPVFLKPFQHKAFTGFIYRGPTREAVRTSLLSDEDPVWCSEVVNFVSEYRVYVKDGEILGAYLYKGDWSHALDRWTVEGAVRAYKSSPRAYSLDFGITQGYTRLVEANDSFALGNYGLPSPLYAQMIEARWEELTR